MKSLKYTLYFYWKKTKKQFNIIEMGIMAVIPHFFAHPENTLRCLQMGVNATIIGKVGEDFTIMF